MRRSPQSLISRLISIIAYAWMVCITWTPAIEFCKWGTRSEGKRNLLSSIGSFNHVNHGEETPTAVELEPTGEYLVKKKRFSSRLVTATLQCLRM